MSEQTCADCGHPAADHDTGKYGCRRGVRDRQCPCAAVFEPRPKCWCGAPAGHDWANGGPIGYHAALRRGVLFDAGGKP